MCRIRKSGYFYDPTYLAPENHPKTVIFGSGPPRGGVSSGMFREPIGLKFYHKLTHIQATQNHLPEPQNSNFDFLTPLAPQPLGVVKNSNFVFLGSGGWI